MNIDFKALLPQLDQIDNSSGKIDKDKEAAMLHQLESALNSDNSDDLLSAIARHLVLFAGIDSMLPECYEKFQPIVTEGMIFFLIQLPPDRLARKIMDQMLMPKDTLPGQRINTLIKDMPTLQKLGQMICRTPGLEPQFKHALIELEDNIRTVSYDQLLPLIKDEIKTIDPQYTFTFDNHVLAEASVCAVIAGDMHIKIKQSKQKIVFKLVKPHVRKNISSELKIQADLAHFLDKNSNKWGLGDFKFKDTLNQVQWLLKNEVNLLTEQANMAKAVLYYKKNKHLIIPDCLLCSTPNMTIMTRVEGKKITDVSDLTAEQKRLLAKQIADLCILRPMQDIGGITLFHGDPHAGNIAYNFIESSPVIIFYDWGMMGMLSRLERFSFALMAIGVMTKSPTPILLAANMVSNGQILKNPGLYSRLNHGVKSILKKQKKQTREILSTIEALFAEFSMEGCTFPANLLLFQKTQVTLKGIFADIDPSFNRDDELLWMALQGYVRDLCRPGYYWEVYKEAWSLSGHTIGQILKIQYLVIKLAVKLIKTRLFKQ